MERFYSNGKLFITGEYLVLDGAKAFALPTRFGQDLQVEKTEGQTFFWTSYDSDGSVWFEDRIPFGAVLGKQHSANPITHTLIEILHTAAQMNPEILQSEGYRVATHLTFPRKWGLGTSSTLINNIAQWFGIDAYELLWKSFGGSGYDIACAQHNSALVYQLSGQKPTVQPIDFTPDFAHQLYFVYLNQKQSSKEAIATYKSKRGDLADAVAAADAIADQITQTSDVQTFAALLDKHESMLGEILEMPTVRQKLFPDFHGTVKSLGAWGGDFVLAVSKTDPTDYFKSKGFETVIPYSEMIL